MSVFSDRRRLRQIGGMGAYFHQVAWSVWWRLQTRSAAGSRRSGDASLRPEPALVESPDGRRTRPAA